MILSFGSRAEHARTSPEALDLLFAATGLRIDRVDDAVLQALVGDVLRPADVTAVLDGVLAELSPRTPARERDEQRALLGDLEREIGP